MPMKLTFSKESGTAGDEYVAIIVEFLNGCHALLVHDHGSITIW